MRYLSAGTTTRISRIGLGTWQFGSREWGYGQSYAGQEARAIVRRAVELGVTLFDTAEIYGFGRSERILGEALGEDRESSLPGDEALPADAGRPGRRAARCGQREPARRPPARPVPGAPAQSGGPGRDDHARHARVAAGRVGARGRRQQLLAGPLARRRAGAGQPGAEQPGPLQPGRPVAGARPAAVRGIDRPRRDRLQSARPGAALRQVRPRHPPGEPHPGRQPAVPAREPGPGRRPDSGPARGGGRALRRAPAQIALAWVIHRPAVVAIPGASSVRQLESNAAAADIDLTEAEYQALHAAATRFHPITGPAVLPRLLRSRIAR